MRRLGRLRAGALLVLTLGIPGCDHQRQDDLQDAAALTGGDPGRGREAMRQYGCTTCHVIPGVPGASGTVGPPLTGIASRSYIAGVLTNTPAHMERWIRDPQGVDSLTAMPNLGVTARDARDIAGYLYSLR